MDRFFSYRVPQYARFNALPLDKFDTISTDLDLASRILRFKAWEHDVLGMSPSCLAAMHWLPQQRRNTHVGF